MTTTSTLTRLLPLLVLLAAPLAAQERHRERDRERDRDEDRDYQTRIDTTVALSANATADLSLISGEIIVTAASGNQARVRAYSEHGDVEFQSSPSRLSLSVRSRRGRMGDTRYEVAVPVGTRLLLRTTSGDIRARGVRGEVEAHTTSGDVEVQGGATRVTLESVSGDIHGEQLDGSVRVTATSGDVTLERVTGDVEVETVSGEISITDARSKWVRTETTSGDVDYRGAIDAAGRYDFTSHSGEVTLVVPADAGGQLSVETFSGSIESDFPMTIQPNGADSGGRPKRMQFTFGAGSARISIETFSGDVRIEKR